MTYESIAEQIDQACWTKITGDGANDTTYRVCFTIYERNLDGILSKIVDCGEVLMVERADTVI